MKPRDGKPRHGKLKYGVLAVVLLVGNGAVLAEAEAQTEAVPDGAPSTVQPLAAQSPAPLPLEELQIFAEVFGKIKSEYIDRADDATLLRDAIQGMLAGLDPHSAFLDPEAFKEMRISTEGKFGGLGVEITTEGGFIKVVAPIDDTPAHRAGVRSGDIIVMLDGVPVQDLSLGEAVERMRGPPGSEIVLTISREGEPEMFDLTLVRAIIRVSSVRGELLEDGFGYIRIASFQSGTGASLRARIQALARENEGALKGLVLDLRNNPGGVLQSAVEVSDVFLAAGVIVSTRGRDAAEAYSFSASAEDAIGDAPVVVLVNGGSASSAEIVAGALQDHRRAIIMGTRTFGKGSVQTVIPMNNGGALKLTTARYYTPADRSIQALGIHPDIVVEAGAPVRAEQAEGGREIHESDLAGHLENERAGEDGDSAGPGESSLAARDRQIGAALNLLKGMSLVHLQRQGEPGARAKPAPGEG